MSMIVQIERTAALAFVLVALQATAQENVPIRAVSAPTATSVEFARAIGSVQEIAGGKVLIDANGERRLLLFDASLTNPRALADTMGASVVYPRFMRLVRHLGDSVLMVDAESRSLVMIEPDGKFGRVMAPPRPNDFNSLTSGGPVGVDAQGRLLYQTQAPFRFSQPCRIVDGQVVKPQPSAPLSDSVSILRGDFDTRTVDSVARSKVIVAGIGLPQTVTDANCRILSAKVRIDPSVPETDGWTVTSTGTIAIVRGHDYHIDWIDANGKRSTGKLPFDWRRLTDEDKQRKVDSAKKIVDSLTALGGYKMEACGNSMSFNASPRPAADGTGRGSGGGNGGGSGGGRGGSVGTATVTGAGGGGDAPPPSACQTLTVAAEFPALGEMADYIAPIRNGAVRADLDGNVWILPTTSKGANGGLLYDVVNSQGQLTERVQLPADRDIAGFGHNGVLYLIKRSPTGATIERVVIQRPAKKA